MRLLNARTLRLEEFFNSLDGRPHYVILSHTWGKDEVTLDDLRNGAPEMKRGFAKLKLTCKQALRDGYEYAWIDTCCIDKSSSSELSEAINSMFQWYRLSKICYAYLEDVSVEDLAKCHVPDDNHMSSDEEGAFYQSKFAQSRWFQRGWTLQELIAPSRIEFYSSDWNYLGSSLELLNAIVMVTGITNTVLSSEESVKMRSLQEASIAQRMSWAAKRKTTRVEDEAYCLMGIFGVHIPLLYGEGRSAFVRLQEEIIKASADQSIFAWESSGPERRQLLAPDPSCFQHAGTVIQVQQQSGQEPFSMTNLGLSIRMPIADAALNSYKIGILACRYANDISGPIALDLTRASTDEHGVQSFYISDFESRRTSMFDLQIDRVGIPSKMPIILLRQPPIDSLFSTSKLNFHTGGLETPTTFVIDHPAVMLKEFYPSRHWTNKSFESHSGFLGQYENRHTLWLPMPLNIAAVLLNWRGFSIIVTFGIRKRNWHREEKRPWIDIHQAQSGMSLRDFVQNAETLGKSRAASKRGIIKISDDYLNMEIVRKSIMNDDVFFIKFSVESNSKSDTLYVGPADSPQEERLYRALTREAIQWHA
ncbi:uncharacterized protein PAC_14599 [Phialocephala subalpina]|uniref:Uncharacterized protein n=1 Tax=Phialocephala subalpina TaxID=576137 RepID=A0A1L7XI36_9HELO|nr:uncharacterized protein PAC_14599 [Phialocephala subalpina]